MGGVIGPDTGNDRSVRPDGIDGGPDHVNLLGISGRRGLAGRAIDDDAVIALLIDESVRQFAGPTQVDHPFGRHRSHHGREQTAENGSRHARPPCIPGAHGSHEMPSAG